MKRFAVLSVLLILLGVSVHAGAAENVKIAYVDLQEALNSSDAGKEAKALFKTEVDRIQAQIDVKQKELKKLKDELEKQGLLLSPETRNAREKEYQEKLKNFQRFVQDSQEELQNKDAKLTRKVLMELHEVIIKFGKEKGYTAIFEKGESNLLYAPKEIDITSEVVKRYNESGK